MDQLKNEICPVCRAKTLTLTEDEQDIPYFGKVYLFGMECSSCNFKESDLELAESKEPARYTFTLENTKDLNVRVVKSSTATLKIPQLKITVEPGAASEGYISNLEGVLHRIKKILEVERDAAEDDETRKNAKNLLKKIWKVECGDIPLKVILEDPNGNSAIISEKTIVEKIKKK